MISIKRVIVLLLVLAGSSHLTLSLSQVQDRRKAINQVAGIAFGTSAGFGTASTFPSVALAESDIATKINPIATLSDGSQFPLASFGLQVYDDAAAYKLTLTALECGYRNFFSSVLAGNQKGFAKAVKESNIPRKDLYICGSVVSNRANGFDNAKTETTKGWMRNMEAFGVGGIDYLDQIMLDYPGPSCDSIRGQWSAFEEMHKQKLTKSISVSNFNADQLDCVLNTATVKPVVNQLPFSVAYHPGDVVAENNKRGILVQAYAPLGGSLGGRFDGKVKKACSLIGKQHEKSYAQIALRWVIQSGGSFTTQSKNKDHFSEDLNIFDFELTQDEMKILNSLS